jgi:PBP1b-binding outer membrane lipoprotein LpoB
MKKYLIIASLIVSAFTLSSCGTPQKTEIREQKLEVREGVLQIKSGEVYLLSTTDGIVNITSNKVNLDNYLKKKIKVTGMFSGDTLYVDKLE